MNILFIASDNNRRSGAFLSMVRLTSLLQKKFKHNILVVLPKEGDGKELLDAEGIENILIPSYDWTVPIKEKYNLIRIEKTIVRYIITRLHIRDLSRLVRSRKIDIVHINTSWTYIGALAALKEKKPFIWHIREFLEEDQKRTIYKQPSAYALMRKANRIVAISESIGKKYAQILSKDKLVVIKNGIDTEKYGNYSHNILIGDSVQLLMVGGLSEYKGQKYAIHACALLRAKGKDNFRLRLVGGGDPKYVRKLRMLTNELNVSDIVDFCGPQEDTPSYYSTADIFLMCSKAEAFGRVTVEAMMGGCLVVGNCTAGTRELIEDGVTGFLYEDGNVNDLVKKIEYALNHKDEARRIADNGRRFALNNLSADINARKIHELYQQVRDLNVANIDSFEDIN